jgi:hypothetical protein
MGEKEMGAGKERNGLNIEQAVKKYGCGGMKWIKHRAG